MLVNREDIKPTFQPVKVSITITSEEEMQTLKAFIRNASGKSLKDAIEFHDHKAALRVNTEILARLLKGLNDILK